MCYTRLFTLLLAILTPLLLQGTDKSHVLNGQLKVKGGETYPYKLVFDVASSKIKGYSYTTMPDGTENRTTIKGLINKTQHVIIFSETKLLSAEQKDATTCLVSAVLLYRLKGNNYIIAGPFKGKDSEQKDCGDGTVEFTQPAAQDSLYAPDTARKTTPGRSESGLVAKSELAVDTNKITAGVQKRIDWYSDSCTIDLWDGGVIDGDIISVLVNDQKVLSNYTLTREKKQVKFLLKTKLNTVSIMAEDEGVNPPNTAQIILYDSETQYRLTAFNKRGEKATIVITRK